MRITLFFFLLVIGFSTSLKSQTKTFNLEAREGRIAYLKAIYSNDKAIRLYEDSVMAVAGFRSSEHLSAIDSLYMMDSILTIKIDDYLKTYGYPEKDYYGEIATMTPWVILNHSPIEKIRLDHFKLLYRAYKDENLEERRILDFLEREYRERFQKNLKSYNVGPQRIKELMSALELKKT